MTERDGIGQRPLDAAGLTAANEAYWAAEGGTYKSIEAAIHAYIGGVLDHGPAQCSSANDKLHDALDQAVGWIEECGSDYEGRQFVLTEARAALRGFRIIPRSSADADLAAIVEQADWHKNIDSHAGLAFHLAAHWPKIRAALGSRTPAERDSPPTRSDFDRIIAALRYDGRDENSLTVGEIRRALP